MAAALQSEILLRSIGAQSFAIADVPARPSTAGSNRAPGTARGARGADVSVGGDFDWAARVTRDVHDLLLLTQAALEAGSPLPAGLDQGIADPNSPYSRIEAIHAADQEMLRVLTGLQLGRETPWHNIITDLAARRRTPA